MLKQICTLSVRMIFFSLCICNSPSPQGCKAVYKTTINIIKTRWRNLGAFEILKKDCLEDMSSVL